MENNTNCDCMTARRRKPSRCPWPPLSHGKRKLNGIGLLYGHSSSPGHRLHLVNRWIIECPNRRGAHISLRLNSHCPSTIHTGKKMGWLDFFSWKPKRYLNADADCFWSFYSVFQDCSKCTYSLSLCRTWDKHTNNKAYDMTVTQRAGQTFFRSLNIIICDKSVKRCCQPWGLNSVLAVFFRALTLGERLWPTLKRQMLDEAFLEDPTCGTSAGQK